MTGFACHFTHDQATVHADTMRVTNACLCVFHDMQDAVPVFDTGAEVCYTTQLVVLPLLRYLTCSHRCCMMQPFGDSGKGSLAELNKLIQESADKPGPTSSSDNSDAGSTGQITMSRLAKGVPVPGATSRP